MRNNFLAVLVGFSLIGSTWAQGRGVITGTVLDEHGTVVAKAKVHVSEKGVFVGHRLVQFHETDADGHFRIGHVSWGSYIVMVGKEDAGYPDTKFAFYDNGTAPTVVLTEDSPIADVTLKLGPKAGSLEVAPVTDQLSGKEIRSAVITLRHADSDVFITTSTTVGHILVPSLTDIVVSISAPGYKSWPAPDRAATEGRISLRPEQTQKLQVSLQPEEPTKIGDIHDK